MLYNGLKNLHPVLLQRRVPVTWDWDLAHLGIIVTGYRLDNVMENTSDPSANFSLLIGGKAGLSGAVVPDTTESTSETPDSVSMTASCKTNMNVGKIFTGVRN